jgi:hypothetical protein
LRFDLATKLTDGDAAMNEEESLAQHGFVDYTLAPESVSCRPMATAASVFYGDRRAAATVKSYVSLL